MKICFKIVGWEEFEIHEEAEKEIIKAVNYGEIENSSELIEKFEGRVQLIGIDYETTEQMTLMQNKLRPTIEVQDNNYEVMTDNNPYKPWNKDKNKEKEGK